ncbi:MAG: DUF5615 family PIN-like protein [Caldilinea sp.]
MRILIDESLPRYTKRMLTGHYVATVPEMGWTGTKNGQLLALAEDKFDVCLTADRNLRYQQNLTDKKLAIIVFPSNRLSVVKLFESELHSCLSTIQIGQLIELAI